MGNSIRFRPSRIAALGALGVALGTLAFGTPVAAQVVVGQDPAQLTLEGYLNLTAAEVDDDASSASDSFLTMGGLRALGRVRLAELWDIGARVTLESVDEDLRVQEGSILLFGAGGRLEIGERMGLPDVLTGYAPNNFTFTSAEFGPASGASLDPAGRLQTAFLETGLAAQIDALTTLGVTAGQFADQSPKILYVSPKRGGWLAGLSFAPDADDSRFDELAQAGVTHERYWRQNVLRVGGTYSYARGVGEQGLPGHRDLHSLGLGATVILDDALMLGLAVSRDGRGGLPSEATGSSASVAWGATFSANYNYGPWTVGSYYQHAMGEGDGDRAGDDRLSAFELGASYRWNTRFRVYGGWFRYDFTDEGDDAGPSDAGSVLLIGIRAAL